MTEGDPLAKPAAHRRQGAAATSKASPPAKGVTGRRDVVALVRHVLKGPCRVLAAPEGGLALIGPGRTLVVRPEGLRLALSRGLVAPRPGAWGGSDLAGAPAAPQGDRSPRDKAKDKQREKRRPAERATEGGSEGALRGSKESKETAREGAGTGGWEAAGAGEAAGEGAGAAEAVAREGSRGGVRAAAKEGAEETAGERAGEGESRKHEPGRRRAAEDAETWIVATPAAAAFLRRALLSAEEGFAAQHRHIEAGTAEVAGEAQTVWRNLAESPLGGIARLKDRSGEPFLPPQALEAGERLHADFTFGQLQPRVTASWEPRLSSRGKAGGRGGQADLADTVVAARLRLSRAVEAMGPELSGVALDVCCFGKGLEVVERERQWPSRSAKLMLRTALLLLSRHYHPPAPPPRARSHHWGSEDFRPVLR